MKKLYKVEFENKGSHTSYFLTASQFCQIGKKIEEIQKALTEWKFERLTVIGNAVFDEVLEIYEND